MNLRYLLTVLFSTLISVISTAQEETHVIDEVTEYLKDKVWVNHTICYGDSCTNHQYTAYYFWDGSIKTDEKDGIQFRYFELSSVMIQTDSNTNRKTPIINNHPPSIAVLSKDENIYPAYNCLYKSEGFSGFVELKTNNKKAFALKGTLNNGEAIITLLFKKVTPPPAIKKVINRAIDKD